MLGLLPLLELLFECIWLRIVVHIHHFGNLVVAKLVRRFLTVQFLRVLVFAFLFGAGESSIELGAVGGLLLVLGQI